jgi:hypothetical protein
MVWGLALSLNETGLADRKLLCIEDKSGQGGSMSCSAREPLFQRACSLATITSRRGAAAAAAAAVVVVVVGVGVGGRRLCTQQS